MDENIFPDMGSMYSYERDHRIKEFKCTNQRHAYTVTKIERTRISRPLNRFEKISKGDDTLQPDDRQDVIDYDPMTSEDEDDIGINVEPMTLNPNPYEEDSVDADSEGSNYNMQSTSSNPTNLERKRAVE